MERRCGQDSSAPKPLTVDFLYLDLNTCSRCIATDTTVDEAVNELAGVFDSLGYEVTVNKVNITSRELAELYRFVSSPTIRVNGIDICSEVKESLCTDCGDICGCDTTCRVFVFDGKEYDQPPKAMVMDGILKALYAPEAKREESRYTLPENLEKFFSGVESNCGGGSCGCECGCGDGCCDSQSQ